MVAIPPSAADGPAPPSGPEWSPKPTGPEWSGIPRSTAAPSVEDGPGPRSSAPDLGSPPPPLRLRHSLAARITALVVLVLVATGIASLLLVRQLRALQASFDLLTIVYVEFNKDLTVAYRSSARIGVRVESTNERPLAASEENNFLEALEARSDQVQQARAVLDDALAHPERIGGEQATGPLLSLQQTLVRLEELVAQTAAQGPADALVDVRTQAAINDLFRRLDEQVSRAILDLGSRVRDNERDTERMIAMATLAIAVLGLAAALGVIWTVRPLRRLALGVRRLGRGDWDQRVAPGNQRGDEVSQLAREFNQMADALQERERRLIRGERLAAIGQLAAQVTHEIRNPLASIALNVELLEDEIASASPESRQLLAKITAEIDRLTGITEDYLGFVRRRNPERAPLDLAAELHSLLDFMAEELAAAGVAVVRDLRPGWVLGDAGQLRQAFMNLLRNAREALVGDAPPDPRGDLLDGLEDAPAAAADDLPDRARTPGARAPAVTVRLVREGDRVRAVVADNGPGLAVAADEAEHIFEAFFTRKPQGTGLGLSIVQQIVQDHEGSVRVAATGPEGTAFEIVLPACDPPAPSVSSPGPMPASRPLIAAVVAAASLSSGCNFIFNPAKSDSVIRCKNATECEDEAIFKDVIADARAEAVCRAPDTSGSFVSSKNNLVCSLVDKASVSCDAENFASGTALRMAYDEAVAQNLVGDKACPLDKKGTIGCPSLNGNCDAGEENEFGICDDGSGMYPLVQPVVDDARKLNMLAQDVLDQHCRSYFCDDQFVCNKKRQCVRCDDSPDPEDLGNGACVDIALNGKVSSVYRDDNASSPGCEDRADPDNTAFGPVVTAP